MAIRLQRKVTCSGCGFYASREEKRIFLGQRDSGVLGTWDEYDSVTIYHEVPPQNRGALAESARGLAGQNLHCLKHVFALDEEFKAIHPSHPETTNDEAQNRENLRAYSQGMVEAYRKVITKERVCPFYFEYRQGFNPELH